MKNDYTYHYCDANSILLINHQGKLRKLYTPFKVYCKIQTGNLTKGVTVFVEEVKSTAKDELVFIINEKAYYHSFFSILIDF